MCRNVGIKFLSWTYIYIAIIFLGKYVIQTNPSKFDEREKERDRDRQKDRQTDRQTDRE